MAKFFDKFKAGAKVAGETAKKLGKDANRLAVDQVNKPKEFKRGRLRERKETMGEGLYDDDDDDDDYEDDAKDPYYDDVGIQPAQKPESFHHFILENQYKDLERSIRGYKDCFNKDTKEWDIKAKSEHCFTGEEAEEILRTAQSHLATDIKLSFINKEVFGMTMMAIYKQVAYLFESIAEYRYGRYRWNKDGKKVKDGEKKEYEMKLQNHKIFLELWTRIQANYSRAIQGSENKFTHDSVKGQESLQNSGADDYYPRRYT